VRVATSNNQVRASATSSLLVCVLTMVTLLADVSVVNAAVPSSHRIPQSVSLSGPRPLVLGRESVCQMAYQVNQLQVIRNKPLNKEIFVIPRVFTLKKLAGIQAAARALCALPTPPKGTTSCPMDFGVVYTFNFAATGGVGGDVANPVALEASGCEIVTGLGSPRWAETSPTFWGVLGNALGLRSATLRTFEGKLKP